MFSLYMKWLLIKRLGFLFLILAVSENSFAQTYEEAQHRLPPVIYSLNIPENRIVTGLNTTISWSLMGYHDSYNVYLQLSDDEGEVLHAATYSPDRETRGAYSWGDIQSKEFHYRATINIDFVENQDITVRFFGVPPNDPIENETLLSVIVPGGHNYRYADSSGRKILVNGIADEFYTIDEFFSIKDAVCGDEIAQFTAHFREPRQHYLEWTVSFDLPPGIYIDLILPTPNSAFDESLSLGSSYVSAIPGIGTLWSAGGVIAGFFDNGYLSATSYEYSGGTATAQRVRSHRDRKLNMRLRGNPPNNYWYLEVSVEVENLSNFEYTLGPTKIPLRCFGGPSDN